MDAPLPEELTEITGVGEVTATTLEQDGYTTPRAVRDALLGEPRRGHIIIKSDIPDQHIQQACADLGLLYFEYNINYLAVEFTKANIRDLIANGYGEDIEGVVDSTTLTLPDEWLPREPKPKEMGPCPACGATYDQTNLQSGPDAPEVGWEYYDCPECGTQSHPDTLQT